MDTIIRPKHRCELITDVLTSYWAVQMKTEEEYRTGFVSLHSQYAYFWMSQSLIGTPHTHFQFSNIVFGYFSKTQGAPAQSTLIGNHGD